MDRVKQVAIDEEKKVWLGGGGAAGGEKERISLIAMVALLEVLGKFSEFRKSHFVATSEISASAGTEN